MRLIFSDQALKNLKKLDRTTQRRILEKLEFYSRQEAPFKFAERLVDNSYGQWRFRIGDYRALCDVRGNEIIILKIGHRREIYK